MPREKGLAVTRSPVEHKSELKGVEGDLYELNPICAAPGCLRPSDDPHHIVRRTLLGGPFNFVEIEPGVVVGNVVGLCRVHHDQITVDAAWMTWEDGVFLWSDLFTSSTLLDQQPPRLASSGSENPPEKKWDEMKLNGTCPTCLRPLPHKHPKREPARIRRTWSLTVPKDERENGAEMLDTLLEEARKELARAGLPYGNEEAAKYFVLSSSLALFVQHAEEMLADG